MMRSCKELKRIARENLSGHYNTPMGAFLAAGFITFAIELPFSMLLQNQYATTFQTVLFYVVDFLIALVGIVLNAGVSDIHLRMGRHKEYRLSNMFGPIKTRPDRYLIAGFLATVIAFVMALPLAAGVVIEVMNPTVERILLAVGLGLLSAALLVYLELRFSFVFYLLLDHEEMTTIDAYKVSFGLMKQNVGRLLYVYLSFIGMGLLGVITLGIGMLWISPYQSQTLALFYLDVIGELPGASEEID